MKTKSLAEMRAKRPRITQESIDAESDLVVAEVACTPSVSSSASLRL